MLVDRPVEIGPLAGDLQVGLVGEPPVTGSVAAWPGSFDELRGESLHPPLDGDVINGDPALGQQLLDVALGQAVAQIPADRARDHLPREPEASEDRAHTRRTHPTSLSSHPRSTNATVPHEPQAHDRWSSRPDGRKCNSASQSDGRDFRHAQRSQCHEPAGQEGHGFWSDTGTPSRRIDQPPSWLPVNTRWHIFVNE
jgi:hypothetical protein